MKEYRSFAGSDEVGTGDYFGPVCVCVCEIKTDDVDDILKLGVKDSKKLTDKKILSIYDKLIELVNYEVVLIKNEDYNELNKTHNANAIKAFAHNLCYLNFLNKYKELPPVTVVDQFAPSNKYYSYLREFDVPMVKGLSFEEKAESKYLSVACASVIARHYFIKAIDDLSSSYGIAIPKGAGKNVDDIGYEIVEKYGWETMRKMCKISFSNTGKIKKKINQK